MNDLRCPQVLYFLSNGALDEQGKAFLTFVESIRESSIRVLLLSEKTPLSEELKSRGVEVEVLAVPTQLLVRDFHSLKFLEKIKSIFICASGLLLYYRKLFRYFRMYPFDVVHAEGTFAQWLSIGFKVRFNTPLVWRIWSIPASRVSFLGLKWAASVFCDYLVMSSRTVGHEFARSRRWSERLATLYRSYNLASFANTPGLGLGSSPTIALWGDLVPWKGYKTFLRALELVRREVDNCSAVLFVTTLNSNYRPELEGLIAECDLQNAIRVIECGAGIVDGEIASHFRNQGISLYINASVQLEIFDAGLLEAMGSGIPVVVPRGGVWPEFVLHEESGLLFTTGDANALAEAILRVIKDNVFAAKLAKRARSEFQARFSCEKYIDSIRAIYRKVAEL